MFISVFNLRNGQRDRNHGDASLSNSPFLACVVNAYLYSMSARYEHVRLQLYLDILFKIKAGDFSIFKFIIIIIIIIAI